MDIRMPIMNGIEAMARILGKNRHVAAILNRASTQYRENFMTRGPNPMS
jgi:CheY-like chemotaxis protein